MSLTLNTTANVQLGSFSPTGFTALTICCTWKAGSVLSSNERMIHRWGNSGTEQGILFGFNGTDFGLIVAEDGTTRKGRYAASSAPTSGVTYRLLGRWSAATDTLELWLDGSQIDDTTWLTASPASIGGDLANVFVGYEADETINAADGDYSEVGIWNRYLSDDEVVAITGSAVAPIAFPRGLACYARLLNTADMRDPVGGFTLTNTSGTTADHPRIIQPSRQLWTPFAAAAAPSGNPWYYYQQQTAAGAA